MEKKKHFQKKDTFAKYGKKISTTLTTVKMSEKGLI